MIYFVHTSVKYIYNKRTHTKKVKLVKNILISNPESFNKLIHNVIK